MTQLAFTSENSVEFFPKGSSCRDCQCLPSFRNTEQSVLSNEELNLLRKLEQANRIIETDAKSLNSLSSACSLSRRDSDASSISEANAAAVLSYLEVSEEDVWSLWSQIVNDWENFSKKKPLQLKELVRKGVPHHFRSIVWPLLCGAYQLAARQKYVEYIQTVSPCEKIIRRDIARTYPEHDFFKTKNGLGQESLCNVMKAYSVHDREVGYCQGSAFIAGLFLMVMPEEDAFSVFVKLMQDKKMRDMFKPSMPELGLCMFQLDALVHEHLPELHAHFRSQGFHTSMYASSWFLTLFTTALPLPLAFRIMDIFLCEGMEIVFRIAVAILRFCRETLLQLDMEGMLKKGMPSNFEDDPDSLMSLAFNVKYDVKRMRRLQKEYLASRSREQEELKEFKVRPLLCDHFFQDAALQRLKDENYVLHQRVRALEDETAMLADRLVKGQVNRAEEAESAFVLERELQALRHRDTQTSVQLERARNRIRELSLLMEEQGSSRESSLQEMEQKSELLRQHQEVALCLQSELITARLNQAEAEVTVRELRRRIQEYEEQAKERRQVPVDNTVAQLQEELIASRLREAETTLSLKELRDKVSELESVWQKYKQDELSSDDLMSLRLKDTRSQLELAELRNKVMELETQLRSELMLARIREAENKQCIAELAQKISALECKNEELAVEGELSKNPIQPEFVRRLQERLKDMTNEVVRLKLASGAVSFNVPSIANSSSSASSENDLIEDYRLNF